MSTTICKAGAALARHRQQKYYQPPSGGGGGGVCSLLQPEQQVEQEIGFRRSSRGVAVPLCDEISGRQWQALPRSSLWKGRSGSKEALLVVRDLIRHERGAETAWKLHLLVRSKVSRLLKLDLLATLNELQRLDKVDLALMIFVVVRRELWYRPEVYLYRDMLNCLGRNKRTAQARIVLDDAKREGINPSASLCSELMVTYLKQQMPCEAVEIFEEVKSAGACDKLIYNVLVKELHQLGKLDLWLKYKKEYRKTFWGEEYEGLDYHENNSSLPLDNMSKSQDSL